MDFQQYMGLCLIDVMERIIEQGYVIGKIEDISGLDDENVEIDKSVRIVKINVLDDNVLKIVICRSL